MRDTIHCAGLKLPVLIGIHAHEQGKPQTIEVDLAVETNFRAGTERDERSTMIDYQLLVERLEKSTQGRHFDLVEALAVHLAKETLTMYRFADAVSVKVMKRPDGMPQVSWVGAECVRSRSDFLL